jgi:hypothetical protein
MVAAPEYSFEVQGKIICAICVLHNFICVHNPDEDLEVADAELSRRMPRRSTADFGVLSQWKRGLMQMQDEMRLHSRCGSGIRSISQICNLE